MDNKYLQKKILRLSPVAKDLPTSWNESSRGPKEKGEGRKGRVKERKKKREINKEMRWKE